MEKKQYVYDYPMPSVTVDCAVFRYNNEYGIELLLIKRKNEPFKDCWALPGGYMEIGEDLETAVKREVLEETGIDITKSRIAYYNDKVFDKPDRDSRGRTISFLSIAGVAADVVAAAGDDAKELKWFSVRSLPPLAFDHAEMVEHCKTKFLNWD